MRTTSTFMLIVFPAVMCWGQPSSEAARERAISERERVLGQALLDTMERSTPRLNDGEVDDYIARMTRILSPHCAPELKIETRVLVSSSRTAHALPGGFLVLNTGLIEGTDSEAELAGIVAHLMSYLRTARPIAVSRDSASIPTVFMGGWAGYTYGANTIEAMPAGMAKTVAASVIKADEDAAGCMARSGYDPEPFVESLRKLDQAEKGGPPFPYVRAADRIRNVEAAIAALPPAADYLVDRAGFAEIRSRAANATHVAGDRRRTPPSLLKPSR